MPGWGITASRLKSVMKLLNDEQLEKSSIVANSFMNRERKAFGVNSYEREIFINPVSFLKERLYQESRIEWLDLCCGRGKALIQTIKALKKENIDRNFQLTGVDLVGLFDPVPKGISNIEFVESSLIEFNTDVSFDLITCVHGIHYIGDKLGIIQKFIGHLKQGGLFVGNVDTNNIFDHKGDQIGRKVNSLLRKQGILYDTKKKLLKCMGERKIIIPMQYLGADDNFGRNYTGQAVVSSYYQC